MVRFTSLSILSETLLLVPSARIFKPYGGRCNPKKKYILGRHKSAKIALLTNYWRTPNAHNKRRLCLWGMHCFPKAPNKTVMGLLIYDRTSRGSFPLTDDLSNQRWTWPGFEGQRSLAGEGQGCKVEDEPVRLDNAAYLKINVCQIMLIIFPLDFLCLEVFFGVKSTIVTRDEMETFHLLISGNMSCPRSSSASQ